MEKHQVEALTQGGATEGLDEKELWKERLRKEILEEEKKRIIDFEVTKKVAEIEKLLDIAGKPAKVVLAPTDGNVSKVRLGLEHDTSLSYQFLNTGNGISSAPATLDGGAKGGSELGLSLEQDDSAKRPKSPVEEAKPKKKPLEGEQNPRPRKKQKTGSVYSCPLCGVTATSQTNLDNHFLGKKHQQKQSLQNKKPLNSDPEGAHAGKEINMKRLSMKLMANGKLFQVYKKGNSLWCDNSNCNFTCADSAEMVLHLIETEHEACENGKEDKVVAEQ